VTAAAIQVHAGLRLPIIGINENGPGERMDARPGEIASRTLSVFLCSLQMKLSALSHLNVTLPMNIASFH
jgi:hypothetical protein